MSSTTLIIGDLSALSVRIVCPRPPLHRDVCSGMEWDLFYALQISKPRTFQELAIKAHGIEMAIANRCGESSTSYEFKDKGETKKSSKPSKASTREFMATSAEESVWISGKSRSEEKKYHPQGMVEGSDLR